MPNHYHLVLQQLVDDGIKKFMTKLNVGYAQFFNIKYQRVGPLMQGAYKANILMNEGDVIWATRYVHMNILDYSLPEWRDGSICNPKKAIINLKKYEWSDCSAWIKKDPNYINLLIPHLSER